MNLDFQTRYAFQQTQESFAWCRTQFSTLAESLKEIANKIARLEVLINVLD